MFWMSNIDHNTSNYIHSFDVDVVICVFLHNFPMFRLMLQISTLPTITTLSHYLTDKGIDILVIVLEECNTMQ